ncbi:MAG: COX15/CtaA family protein [Rhodospirillales bacterium]|nr:COX15/CtaA family protein [Rhodospirillales bacterium]
MSSNHNKALAAWLFAVAALIFAMIVLGGVTRLTQSGLSMVDWKPVTGWLPPMTDSDWQTAFERYKNFPEYEKRNLGMTVEGFKSIFWLEFLHRLLGRFIGVAFFVPLVVFWAKGWIGRKLAPKLVVLFVLGGLQGVLGWYMVKSGLVSRPDVSQYRLAAHFGLALLILGPMLWVALGLIRPVQPTAGEGVSKSLRQGAKALLGLVCLTALSGAFVAGLDAGFTYNTFPLMDGKLVPDGLLDLSPAYLNFFENIATVQFDHRILAIGTVLAVVFYWLRCRAQALTDRQRRAVNVLAMVACVQVALGISTLLLVVPVPLAAMHQAIAVIMFCVAVWMVYEFRAPGA